MAQVGVTLGGFDLGVAQQALHLIEAATRVDQEAGIGVPEVVNTDIRQTSVTTSCMPRKVDGHIRLERFGVGKSPLTIKSRDRLQ